MSDFLADQPPHAARFSYVATKMRPLRDVVEVDARADGVTLTLSCGHQSEYAPHFTYAIGERTLCGHCGTAAASELPEFKGFYSTEGDPICAALHTPTHGSGRKVILRALAGANDGLTFAELRERIGQSDDAPKTLKAIPQEVFGRLGSLIGCGKVSLSGGRYRICRR